MKDTPGVDNSVISWYPVPHAVITIQDSSFQGTDKHMNCSKFVDKDTRICQKCKSIPSLHSFKQRILLRAQRIDETGSGRSTSSICYEYLNYEVMRTKDVAINKKNSQIFLLSKTNVRLKIRVQKRDRTFEGVCVQG